MCSTIDENSILINALKGISDKRTALYKKLGIITLNDLITYYPHDYIDYTSPKKISETEIGEACVFRARVEKKLKPYIGRITLYKLVLSDDENEILCNIWGNEYSFRSLCVGQEYYFYGKIDGSILMREISSPLFILPDNEEKIIPKYHLTKGLTNVMLGNNIKSALEICTFAEPLTAPMMIEYDIIARENAIREIHFPKTAEGAEKARKRLIFDELLILQLGLSLLKTESKKLSGVVMKEADISEFFSRLPFSPTSAQIRAVNECIDDMKKNVPMSRLLQGDVGSGKTLVAAALCFFAYKNGYQAAVMVPTEILANQHFITFKETLGFLGVETVLLTAGLSAAQKKTVLSQIESGRANVIVGTHALIQSGVSFYDLGFTITDEQHRFGVKQRGSLSQKGVNPHMLVMSATPIPRTLALLIYGDLDLSVLDEMPKGRIAVKTYAVGSSYRERIYKFIIKHVRTGKQAYIVCPMIDEGVSDKAGAVKYYESLKDGWFADIPIGLLHGRMKESEKNSVMSDFKENKVSVLVSTTVIEVGVDVPNAVIMLIENAERFGLSQLHQLRGRVVRGRDESYCILLSDSKTPYTKARLDTMVRTANGFEIASEDLKLRGPGDFFGSKQHGLPELKIADMSKDVELISQSKRLADKILENDRNLEKDEHAVIRRMIKDLFNNNEKYGFN